MTSTDIANKALGLIGVSSIDSIDDNTTEAIYSKAWYDDSRKTLIRELSPAFARREVLLALASGESSAAWDNVYGYPSDCLSIREIYNPTGRTDRVPYEVGAHSSKTSRVILTNQDAATLIYYADIENLNMFSPDQILALAYLLAKSLAGTPIQRNQEKEKEMTENFAGVLELARKNNLLDQSFDQYDNRSFDADNLTPTDIANRALRHLGVLPIDLITNTKNDVAIQCNEEYINSIRTYLKDATPGWARKEADLVIASGEASDKYEYVYTYPSDCILAKEIMRTSNETTPIVFETGNHSAGTEKVILTDHEDAILIYTEDVTTLSRFSDDELNAISYLLASKVGLVVPKEQEITIKVNLVAKAEANYQFALAKAMMNNKRDQHTDLQKNEKYITARR